ncbi:MAG: hypothetical protein KTR31_14435 [Myxococcales bacterium]|nr:hypothetical protein [Myxococcales bacterium]
MGNSAPRVARWAIAVLAVTYFALWACGPATFGPPPTPMADGNQHELGVTTTWLESIGEQESCVVASGVVCRGPSLAAWYRFQTGRADIGVSLFGGNFNVGVGMQFRARFIDEPRVFWALQLDAGFLYGAVGLPAGIAISDEVWLYVSPQVRAQLLAPFRLGAGVTWRPPEKGLRLGAELGASHTPGVPAHVDLSVTLGHEF